MQTRNHESPPSTPRRLLAAVGVVAMAFGLAGLGSPAYAAEPEPEPTGSIAGVVTGEAGTPLEGVGVQVFFCEPEFDPLQQRDCWTLLWGEGKDAHTAADGSFSIDGLEPGTYRAAINPQQGTAQYVREYWDATDVFEEAIDLAVVAGAATVIEPTLEVGATVSGVVVDEAGEPVSGGFVYAYLTGDLNSTRGGASIAADGTYTIPGLPAGEYVLKAGPGWGDESDLVDEYWQDAPDLDSATRLELTLGQSVTADFELNDGAVVEGTVSAEGAPVEGVEVAATYAGPSDQWVETATAVTGADGTYRISGLQQGDYVVDFSDFDGEWAHQYWQGTADRSAATTLALTPGDLADGVDADLTAGGGISGVLTENADGDSAPASRAYFDVLRKNAEGAWEKVASESADETGAYEVSGLAPGEYTVLSYGSSSADWAWTYLGGVYFTDEAAAVEVAASAVTAGVDVETAPGVRIAGSVIDEHGGPAAGVSTRFLYERAPGVWAQPEQYGGAGDDISFRVGGLPPGDYVVEFADRSGAEDPYVTQYWENAPTQAEATVLEAPNGGSFTDVNAVMTRTAVEPEPEPAVTPTIDGVAQVGQALVADSGDWGADAELAYQWLAGGEPVDGATDAEFTPADDLVGATLAVAVTGTRPGAEPLSATSVPTAAVLPRFADPNTSGAHAANVRWAGANGVIDGIRGDDGIVRYDGTARATRGVAAIALYRLAGSPEFELPATPTFTDVPADHEAYRAVEYLASIGVVAKKATFGPGDALQRQHLATFLHRSSAPSFTPPTSPTFSDVPKTSAYFTAIEWVASEGLTSVSGTFRPAATTSRAELATFLNRWQAL